MYCIEEKTCDIVGTFRRPQWFGAPEFVPPRYAPGVTLRNKVRSYEISRALNVEPFLRIERSQLRSAMYPECPRKTGEANPAG